MQCGSRKSAKDAYDKATCRSDGEIWYKKLPDETGKEHWIILNSKLDLGNDELGRPKTDSKALYANRHIAYRPISDSLKHGGANLWVNCFVNDDKKKSQCTPCKVEGCVTCLY